MTTRADQTRLGRIGLWSLELRFGDRAEAEEAAAELDELGYGALWIPGGIDGAVLGDVDRLLSVTKRTTIATGILNIWKHEPKDVAAWWKGLSDEAQARVLLGLGVSHAPLIGEAWKKPLSVMGAFLDKLSKEGMPADKLCLAALGPKMLELSRDRTAGAHPYLVTPEHTARAREILGPGKLLAPEQGVILESDPGKARDLGRAALGNYLHMPNYKNSWRRLGFSEDDIETVSDRLVDGLFAWGGLERIKERVAAHHSAGADHVCLQVIPATGASGVSGALPAWRELAGLI